MEGALTVSPSLQKAYFLQKGSFLWMQAWMAVWLYKWKIHTVNAGLGNTNMKALQIKIVWEIYI